jgi:hypothetical protein
MVAIIIGTSLFVFANGACWYGLEPGAALAASSIILYFEARISNLGEGMGVALGAKVFQPFRGDWMADLLGYAANVGLTILGAYVGWRIRQG